jgi:tartrate dehydratase beta subunit/fumarate hydratase class I family protein
MRYFSELFLLAVLVTAVSCGKSQGDTEQAKETNEDSHREMFQVMENTELFELSLIDEEIIRGSLGEGATLSLTGRHYVGRDQARWIEVFAVDAEDGSSKTFFMREEEFFKLPIALLQMNDSDEEQELRELGETTIRIDQHERTFIVMSVSRMTYCYKYVKQYLLKKKLVSVYLPGGSAYMAATILPKYGFTKVSRKPSQAIVHDVCVYKGGPSGHGHIEVKTSSGWYYGYGYKKAPIKNRIFIGCFHKK